MTHIDLGLSRPPLSLNDRMHWRVKAQHVAQLRLRAARLARNVTPVERAVVTLHYRPRDARRRDADNLFPTLKPCIDGLRDAGVIADDDSTRVDPRVRIHPPEPGMPGALWLTIDPTEET